MKKIFFLSLIFLFSLNVKSSHLMGGEITWECIKIGPDAGKYIFKLKVYRDCSGITVSTFAQTITVWGHPSVSTITANFVSQTDVSPLCDPINSGNAQYSCASGNLGAVEEYLFETDPIQLPGSPNNDGWHFTWTSCCRNPAIVNLAVPQAGFTLRASMYPYFDPSSGLQVPADPCFDSSPNFKEQPKTILCIGFPFSYSHNASDPELDELVYSWDDPLDDGALTSSPFNPGTNPLTIGYSAPYSTVEPLPGSPTLDPVTGEVSYDANTAGFFVTCVKVQAYKCNQLVAEIFREVQVVLVSCPTMPGTGNLNNPPSIDQPFVDPLTSLPSYESIVYAGTLVNFNIEGIDNDLYPASINQNLTMEVSGGQFSTDFTNTNLCLNPPCATFNSLANLSGSPPPFSNPGIVSGVFNWQTSCAHINAIQGCGATTSTFTFLVKVHDDFCPAYGITIATITITVVPPIPDLRCISVLPDENIKIDWQYAPGAPPTNEPYYVYHSLDSTQSFTLIDSVFHPSTTYIDDKFRVPGQSNFYFLATDQSCGITTGQLHSDTLTSINMNINPQNFGTQASLIWNSIKNPLLSTSDTIYKLFYKRSDTWSILDSTNLLSYLYLADSCNYYPSFYVEIDDQSGCSSISSISTVNLLDSIPPSRPIITDVSVDNNNLSNISWENSVGANYYVIYKKDEFGAWITIDSVSSNTYIYDNSNAGNIKEIFQIRALDSCDNASLTSDEHNSIYLSYTLNACENTMRLNWNEYINWVNGVSSYKVFVESKNLNNSVNIDEYRLDTSKSFILNNIQHNFEYNIYVLASNGDSSYIARSNQLSLVPKLPKRPDFHYIEYATVNHQTSFVDILCRIDNTAIIDKYLVYRTENNENTFSLIGEIPFDSNLSSVFYTDNTANTDKFSYNYIIFPVDTCGEIISIGSYKDQTSGITTNDTSYAKTILLNTEINNNSNFDNEYINSISFNEYKKWLGNISSYEIYRSINREPFFPIPIYTFDRTINPNQELKFTDIVTEYGDGNGRFCYYIKAIEGDNNPFSIKQNSLSNVSCVSQTPILFVPNTFTPNLDEHNELFLPITYFVSNEGYSFSIYNRNGLVLFSTNDPSKGWDGTYNGEVVQDGSYIYNVQYINGVGEITQKIDIVTLIK